ncbi:hypothetical protein DH2020_036528 [Rehmannia glutinosa]|uniref:Uncharacterized protein n=1 Tax=Rehmannia glutinosa TaxID=99300 RepID=A0ABR0V4M6_REHGL
MAAVAANGGSSHSSREARRRRIVERGSDRLALITGRIQSLPRPRPIPFHHMNFHEVVDFTVDECDVADVAPHENVASDSPLPNQESSMEPEQRHIFDETVEPLLENSDKDRSVTSEPVASLGVEEEQSQIPSSIQSPSQVHQNQRNLFTAGQISSAITATEYVRMCCSAAVAILVTLLYIEFPILGCRVIRSVLIFKPFYLLLLTNISIVVGRLILGTRGAELRMGQTSSVPTFGGNGLVDQMGKALELGLLLQNISGALFIDFGIYAIALICGLSVARSLGL